MIFVLDSSYAIEAKSVSDALKKWKKKNPYSQIPTSIEALTDGNDWMDYWIIKSLAEINEQVVKQQSTPTHHRRRHDGFRYRRRRH